MQPLGYRQWPWDASYWSNVTASDAWENYTFGKVGAMNHKTQIGCKWPYQSKYDACCCPACTNVTASDAWENYTFGKDRDH